MCQNPYEISCISKPKPEPKNILLNPVPVPAFRAQSLPHLCHVRDGTRVVHQFPLVHLHLPQSGKAIQAVLSRREAVRAGSGNEASRPSMGACIPGDRQSALPLLSGFRVSPLYRYQVGSGRESEKRGGRELD